MDDLRPEDPRQIGPYWLEGRLGSGGMGNVYLGRSPGGRHVAIKVIRAELATDAEFRARFAQEVTSMRKVSGIFTVAVVDADLHGPTPWLATSYVAGLSLADEVEAHGPLSPGVVLMLAAGLAEGLVALHAAGLVHRDLEAIECAACRGRAPADRFRDLPVHGFGRADPHRHGDGLARVHVTGTGPGP